MAVEYFINYETDKRSNIIAYCVVDMTGGKLTEHARFPVARLGRMAAFRAASDKIAELNAGPELMRATNHAFDRVFGKVGR